MKRKTDIKRERSILTNLMLRLMKQMTRKDNIAETHLERCMVKEKIDELNIQEE